MSWLFSRVLGEEFWEGTCSAGEPYAPSSANPTPQAYLSPDRMTEFSRPSLSGMMFAPLTDDHGAALLTWFRAGFPVRTSARPAKVPGWTENAADCGWKWPASFAKWNPDASMWKTRQCSLLGDSEPFSGTWPAWGSMQSGECLERTTPELPTNVNASGLLPTPTASNTKAYHMRGADKGKVREARSYGGRGPLNPRFLEWHMGWPQGWTKLEPLETVKFHEWQQQHGNFYTMNDKATTPADVGLQFPATTGPEFDTHDCLGAPWENEARCIWSEYGEI